MARRTENGTLIDWYSVAQVAKVSGLSRYMVDYFCRYGVVTPSLGGCRGRGLPRRYSFSDVVLLRVLYRMLEQGISVSKLRKSISSLHQRQSNSKQLLVKRYLVTDGRALYFQDGMTLEMIDTGQMTFAFVLDLTPIRREVTAKLNRRAAG